MVTSFKRYRLPITFRNTDWNLERPSVPADFISNDFTTLERGPLIVNPLRSTVFLTAILIGLIPGLIVEIHDICILVTNQNLVSNIYIDSLRKNYTTILTMYTIGLHIDTSSF